MAHPLTTASITQKGMIASPGAWLILVDIRTSAGNLVMRLVNNTEDVTYTGLTYSAVPFRLAQVQESIKGILPKVSLDVYDADFDFRSTLQSEDGLSGGEVDIRRVWFSDSTTYTDPGLTQYFSILDATWNDVDSVVHFNIGVDSPLTKRFPRDRYTSFICRHIFQGGFCRYAGALTTCDHSLTHCRARNNSHMFGGSPGVAEGLYG